MQNIRKKVHPSIIRIIGVHRRSSVVKILQSIPLQIQAHQEYDALPGLSQQVSPERERVTTDAPGLGCGHSGLGTGAPGAAPAVKAAMEKQRLAGTGRRW
jgi:metal-dependent amidase/aminoacylase/carboxypeptidase family protein